MAMFLLGSPKRGTRLSAACLARLSAMNSTHRLWSLLFFILFLLLSASQGARLTAGPQDSRDIMERFVLAEDRSSVLEDLILGTEDYYYFNALEREAAGDAVGEASVLKAWGKRYSGDKRLALMRRRHALLNYDDNPDETYRYLTRELGLSWNYPAPAATQERQLPNRLEAALYSPETCFERAFKRYKGELKGIKDAALIDLKALDLTQDQVTRLLRRLDRPDVPNLVEMILQDLERPRNRGFGSLRVHDVLLLDQLEELARRNPELLANKKFVDAYLKRLVPREGLNWRGDPQAEAAYLDRLQAFVERLPALQASLKAHVLYWRLDRDLRQGKPNRALFLEYLALPRDTNYAFHEKNQARVAQRYWVRLSDPFPTGYRIISNDEDMVRTYLSIFLEDAGDTRSFSSLIEASYLKRIFAETKILAGKGDMERWYSMLDDPAYYERLRERVEINFSPTQPDHYRANDPVAIDVDLKNVGTLLVKVFEINAFNYYREEGKPVGAGIDLDGLVAGSEHTLTIDAPALRRVHRSLQLPELAGPGIYVVELIGNGLSSRAVIKKGSLQLQDRLGGAGHVLRVLDEQGGQLRDCLI